jgi:hypothetical protein
VERQWLANGSTSLLVEHADSVVLKALDPGQAPMIHYAQFDIPLSEIRRLDNELDFLEEPEIHVATHIFGLSTTHWTPVQPGHQVILMPADGK